MIQRITTLTNYLFYRLINSMSLGFYLLGAFAFYWLTFMQRTPEAEYFILVIGFFGMLVSFFSTLSVASMANESKSYPFLVRLNSRIEFLIALITTSLLFTIILQLLFALLVLLRNDPELTLGRVLEIPPLWLSINILASVVALQASDFISYGWSRVCIFGLLALALVIGDNDGATLEWLAEIFRNVANQSAVSGNAQIQFSQALNASADFLTGDFMGTVGTVFNGLFWPFRAIIDGVLTGYFSSTQAWAPALLLVFASFLFLLAADFFSSRDMILRED